MELRQEVFGTFDRTGHELREEADEGREAQEIPLPLDVSQVEVDRVAQGLEGEKGNAHRQQILESERHERGRIRQLHRGVERGENGVQVLHYETGVFEEKQKGEIIDEADEQPDTAAAVESAQR